MPKPSDSNTIPETHHDIVKGNNYAQVAMVMPNGSLANNTVAFVWDGEFVRFSTLKARQKYKNLAGDQRVALCIADPTNPWRYRKFAAMLKSPKTRIAASSTASQKNT
jgi:hypothetical protein